MIRLDRSATGADLLHHRAARRRLRDEPKIWPSSRARPGPRSLVCDARRVTSELITALANSLDGRAGGGLFASAAPISSNMCRRLINARRPTRPARPGPTRRSSLSLSRSSEDWEPRWRPIQIYRPRYVRPDGGSFGEPVITRQRGRRPLVSLAGRARAHLEATRSVRRRRRRVAGDRIRLWPALQAPATWLRRI